jgi:hypothetical protein
VSLGPLPSKIAPSNNLKKPPEASRFCARNSVKVVEMVRDKQVVENRKLLKSKEIRKWCESEL